VSPEEAGTRAHSPDLKGIEIFQENGKWSTPQKKYLYFWAATDCFRPIRKQLLHRIEPAAIGHSHSPRRPGNPDKLRVVRLRTALIHPHGQNTSPVDHSPQLDAGVAVVRAELVAAVGTARPYGP
jgi:hypothetical protein